MLPVALMLVLEGLARSGVLDARFVPTPTSVLAGAYAVAVSGELWMHLTATIARVLTGFALAAALGIGFGLVLGRSRELQPYFMPTFEVLRAIPGVALLPLTVLWFGLGTGSQIPVIAFAGFFPILLNAMRGAEEVPPRLVQAAFVMELDSRRQFTELVLPSSLPYVFTGLRLGVVYALTSGVGAEILAGTDGLGFLILDYQRRFSSESMFAVMILVALLGFALSGTLLALERRLLRYRG